jgi:hypothetical protein
MRVGVYKLRCLSIGPSMRKKWAQASASSGPKIPPTSSDSIGWVAHLNIQLKNCPCFSINTAMCRRRGGKRRSGARDRLVPHAMSVNESRTKFRGAQTTPTKSENPGKDQLRSSKSSRLRKPWRCEMSFGFSPYPLNNESFVIDVNVFTWRRTLSKWKSGTR